MIPLPAAVVVAAALLGLAAAQLPPAPLPVTVIKSKFHENVTVSFREPNICETTPGVKSYAGHVHLPPGLLNDVNGEPQEYPINTFFWFFEARHDPTNAPLAIWLNGGPGGSSFMGLLQENGPCFVSEDSKTTTLNPYSWNNHVNMLYIDQPNQVGLSYDTPTNVTWNFDTELDTIVPADFSSGFPNTNVTYRIGTSSSQNSAYTANSTAQSGHALWHFAQAFFTEFPYYRPHDNRISLWSESYGGHYGPAFMRFFQEQNERIANGTLDDEHAHYLHLDTLGIVNGYLDAVIQEEASITFPYNNTYGIQVFSKPFYEELMHNFTRPGGCREQLKRCQDRISVAGLDVATVNLLGIAHLDDENCGMDEWCRHAAEGAYERDGPQGWFDITHPKYDPFPPSHLHGYMTQGEVLSALGSPVNFSAIGSAVGAGFDATFDDVHGGFLDAVGYLLDHGVKVHMMFGDRDYACNWVGGEKAALSVPYSRADDFAAAGYAPLITDKAGKGGAEVAGMTRQVGNYSFTRVYQAGHMVPSYQPLAAYEIFMRATFDRDIATGLSSVTDDLVTRGPRDIFHIKNQVLPAPEPRCYVLDRRTCSPDVWDTVAKGKAVIKDHYVVGQISEDTYDLGDGEL